VAQQSGHFALALERVIERRKMTNAELARLCGVAPSTIGDFIDGQITVTKKNLPTILRGVTHRRDQIELVLAHLRDETPEEFRAEIEIRLAQAQQLEEPEAQDDTLAAVSELSLLPKRLRAHLISLMRRLAGDAQLRDLVARTVSYLDDEDDAEAFKIANARAKRRAVAEAEQQVEKRGSK
jgi:transcriptional regulator with XRE-family HTH domain